MKKEVIVFSVLIFLVLSSSKMNLADIPTPAGYKEVTQADGDLNKDKIAEKVIVYRKGDKSEMRIFKQKAGKWELWHKSSGAILLDNDHTVLRFNNIQIQRGCIVTYHNSPGRGEWAYTHRYRLQEGKWKLIGVTEHSGYYCDFMSDSDCNLSTKKVILDHTEFKCDEDSETIISEKHEEFTIKLTQLPDMDKVSVSNHEIKVVGSEMVISY